MIDKNNLETFNNIVYQNIDFIFAQNNSFFKDRHNGLAIKFTNDISMHKQILAKTIFYNALDTNNFSQLTTHIPLSTSSTLTNYNDFNHQYWHNYITFLEETKILKIKKQIIKLKKQILIKNEQKKDLNNLKKSNMHNLINTSNVLITLINDLLKLKTFIIDNDNSKLIQQRSKKKYTIVRDTIEKKELLHNNLIKNAKKISKQIYNINTDLIELKKIIAKHEKKIKVITNNFEKKQLQQMQKLNKLETELQKAPGRQELNIINQIVKLERKILAAKTKKKLKKIYEEILPINCELYLITTLIYNDETILEEVIFFTYPNSDVVLNIQTKTYQNHKEYQKDIVLIKNINFKTMLTTKLSVKSVLLNLETEKAKITTSEWIIYFGISIFSLSLLILPVVIPVLIPLLSTLVWKTVFSVIGVGISWLVNKGIWILATDKTKKVETLMKKKFFSLLRKIPFINKTKLGKTKEENEQKNNNNKIITDLKNSNLEIKLKTQFTILKDILHNRKSKTINEILTEKQKNHLLQQNFVQERTKLTSNLKLDIETINMLDQELKKMLDKPLILKF